MSGKEQASERYHERLSTLVVYYENGFMSHEEYLKRAMELRETMDFSFEFDVDEVAV